MPAPTPAPGNRLVHAVATLTLFTVFAGQFWRNLLSWWGFGAVVVIIAVSIGVVLVKLHPDWRWRSFPKSLVAFLVLATLSIAWSFYPLVSVAGVSLQWLTTVGAVFLATCLSWAELLHALGSALRWVLGLSLAFELIVAVGVRHPLLPFFTHYEGKVPQAFYWSRALLLHGGPIEGIVASRNLLGFFALLALIVFAVQLSARAVKRGWGIAWLALALVMLVLTRSATVTVATIAVVVVLLLALWARSRGETQRRPVYLTAVAALLALIGTIIVAAPWLLSIFGKSEDLTGRFDIWASVTELARQRPVFGWGWVSYWAPWVEPFNGLAVRKGVEYLQAHNAWLDVWLQLGVVGVIAFAALALSTLWRSWFLAVDRPVALVALPGDPRLRGGSAYRHLPSPSSSLLPLLLMVALLAQSLAESRLLIEYGWVLLVTLAVATKRHQSAPTPMP